MPSAPAVIGRPALATDPRFSSNSRRNQSREELRAVIVEAFGNLPGELVLARLDAAGIANASINDMRGLWSHAQLAARDRWVEVATAAGPIPALLPPGAGRRGEVRME